MVWTGFWEAMPIFLFFWAHWFLSLFSQTFFYHRYGAHKMFEMSDKNLRRFWLLAYLSQGSSFLNFRGYVVLHRMHHAYADTPKDPHSPIYAGNIFKMMWKTKQIYSNINEGKMESEVEKFGGNELPIWKGLERIGESWLSRISWGVLYSLCYFYFAVSWWMFVFVLPLHFIMGPLHGALVNWCAHKYGSRNFNTKDTSTNVVPIDIFLMGEWLHNNHHHNSTSPNFAVKHGEFDPTFQLIKIFKHLSVVYPPTCSPK